MRVFVCRHKVCVGGEGGGGVLSGKGKVEGHVQGQRGMMSSEGFGAGFHPLVRWRPAVFDPYDSPFGMLSHLHDISKWLA